MTTSLAIAAADAAMASDAALASAEERGVCALDSSHRLPDQHL